ncbi:conjugal transfer protein [Lactococcus lactis]|uniref:conjugal transfer protein n=1 Tax=Lactococcus lactis TaxID=1358 RepID=UPI00288DC13D|nr:conjugal transfer protein [Lactococcus lactis]MDT2909648.1 conjugal transfer protein [Lactococcus lactis]MDT2925716.1 conjugal transfer protein [Lactococcus lactis]
MMNKNDKPFKYVFSETSIESFKKKPEDNLTFSELVNLVQTVNYQIKYLNNESVVISKYTKDGKLIHTEKIDLPVSEHTDFEALLVKFEQTKPPKPTKENDVVSEDVDKKAKKDKPKFQQLSIQSVTMIGFTVLTVCVLGTGLTINHSINQANKQQTKLSQELLLSQLETSEKYDKVAQKMKEFDYPKKDIVNMYLENGQFVNALKADKKAFTSVLDKIDTMNNEEQQKALNELKKANITSKKESISLDLRLALLNKDIDFLKKNIKSVDSQALSDRIVKLFIDEKEYASANEQLKFFANKALDKQAKQAEHDDKKQALTNRVNELKKAISDTQKQLDGKNKQLSDLHKQLDDLNKNDNSPDKAKHVSDKQKEIDAASNDKNKISDTLKDQQAKEKEAQKAVDDFK